MLANSLLPPLKVVVLCLPWYALSSLENVVNKLFLYRHPFPVTISVSHMIAHVFILYPSLRLVGVSPTLDIFNKKTLIYFIPLATLKLMVSIMSHASITLMSVSYANTIKTSMPLLTMALSRKILKEKHCFWELLSMICIIIGVFLATVTEISFNVDGLVCILLAMLTSVGESFVSKLALINLRIDPLSMLICIHMIAFVMIQPLWLALETSLILKDMVNNEEFSTMYFIMMLTASGLVSLGQHMLKISLVALMSPVNYSMANSAKSVIVIVVSLLLLKNPVTLWNTVGTSLALFGLMMYQKMKFKKD